MPALIRASRWLHPVVVDRGVERRRDLLAIVLLFSPFILQELGRVFYYHDWMPNTVRIKGVGRMSQAPVWIGVRYVLFSLSINPALAAFCAVGITALFTLKRGVDLGQRIAGVALLLPWLCCAAFSIGAKGDMINQFRFMAPAAPTLVAAGVIGWSRLSAWLPRAVSLAFPIVPVALVVASMNRDLSIQMAVHNRENGPGRESVLEQIQVQLDQPFGMIQELPRHLTRLLPWNTEPVRPLEPVPWFMAWVLENVPVGGTVMFPDVGLLAYALSDGNVLDARGLNSRGPAKLLASEPPDGPEGLSDPGVVAFLNEFKQISPECLVVQSADGTIWGPPEAALQADGVISSYRGVATGRYVKGEVRVYTLGAQPPTLEQVLARYRKMQEGLPGVLDWESRATALASGQARVAEADWISGDDTITLYPQGAWYQAATFPPR